MKKVVPLSLLLVLAIVAVLWATLRSGEVEPPPPHDDVRVEAPGGGGSEGVQGVAVASTPRESSRSAPQPVDSSWQLEVLVCDTRGQAIAGAEVGVLEDQAMHQARVFDTTISSVVGTAGPRVVGRSDASGRCTTTMTGKACRVAARHVDGRESASLFVQPASLESRPVVLQLLAEVQLQGIVLGDGGKPVADASVTAQRSAASGEFVGRAPLSVDGAVKTDTQGRFVMPARQGSLLRLMANVGSRASFPRDVVVPVDDIPPLVELRLKGAIAVTGMVRDDAGLPGIDVAVFARRLDTPGERVRAFTVHGRFRLELPDYGEFELFASRSGRGSSESVRMRVTPDELSPEIELRLRAPTPVAGLVVDGDGVPLADVPVMAMPEFTDAEDVMPGRDGPRIHQQTVRTAADGTFSIPLDPGLKFTLVVRGEGERRGACTIVPGVGAGTSGLRIVLTRQGVTVRGVVRRADGGEVGRYDVGLLVDSGSWRETASAPAEIDGGRFAVQATLRGGELWATVTPQSPDLAPALLGPWANDGNDLDIEVTLQQWGQLPVRVVDRSGWPVFGAHVWLASRPRGRGESPIATDLDGRATLPKCPPGPMRIAAERFGVRAPGATVQVVPGPNPELRIQLR